MKLAEKCFHFDKSDPAKFRHHVLMHYYKHGWQATCDAFGIGKSTLYDWKRTFELFYKKPGSLVPKSTRPHSLRHMMTDPRLIEFIKTMRQTYGNISKYKIKPFLDQYANSLNIDSIGYSTIGKIIHRRHFFFDTSRRKKRRSSNRLRTRKSPKVNAPGYLQMDGIVVYANNHRHCFISIIDVYTKYAQVTKVPTLSSKQSLRCYKQFISQYTYPIHTVQTDNGSEFLKSFDQYLQQQGIKHIFSYPRSPRVNSFVERFNRTVQEEFIYRCDELYYDLDVFNQKLKEYLNWYNFKRPHAALDYQAPVTFLLNAIPKCG
jgi:hypothetical protein